MCFFEQPALCDPVALNREVMPYRAPDARPVATTAGDPLQLLFIVRQVSVATPHGHQDQQVCAHFLGVQVQGVANKVGNPQRHEWCIAHLAPPAFAQGSGLPESGLMV